MTVSRPVLWSIVVLQGLALVGLAAWLLLSRPTEDKQPALPRAAEDKQLAPTRASADKEPADERAAANGERAESGREEGGHAESRQADGTVRLDAAVQRASALVVAPVPAAEAPEPDAAWGEVLSTRSLTEARQRLLQAAADVEQVGLQVARARQDSARLEAALADGGNVAVKTVEQARNELAAAEQHRVAILAMQAATRDSVRAEWGRELLAALERTDAGVLAPVLDGTQVLVLAAAGNGPHATVAAAEQPGLRSVAERLAPAVQSLGTAAGPTWLWRARAATLRTGQRVRLFQSPVATAGTSARRKSYAGVRVPEDAVVWQAGQAWVFVQRDAEHFEQRAVRLAAPLPGGWFVPQDLAAGTPIVTRGAQLLLSEASKALIRNENGD